MKIRMRLRTKGLSWMIDMEFVKGLKMFWWKCFGGDICPLCGQKLNVHGFEFYNRRYDCPNGFCEMHESNILVFSDD